MHCITRRRFLAQTAATSALVAANRMLPAAPWPPPASRLAADPLRPAFHLLPPQGWMNDPNGPIYYHGQYHMFYQFNPGAAVWGNMHWGHAISPDMIHWRHLPVALAPGAGGVRYDREGCFTGSAVLDHGVPTIIYTGVESVAPGEATLRDGRHNFRETQCLATSADPELGAWTKLPQPVIARPPAGLDITGFRDPCPFRAADGSWLLGVGSGLRGLGGCVLLYRSQDLRHWEYLHKLAEGKANPAKVGHTQDPVASGEMWECPDFFELDGRHVLIFSTEGKVNWQTGSFDQSTLRFHSEQQGLLDYGAFYAPKTQTDAAGQRILWGWITETRPEAEYAAAGWAGVLSLPRVLRVNAAGQLTQQVLPAVRGSLHAAGAAGAQAFISGELSIEPGRRRVVVVDASGNPVLNVERAAGRVTVNGVTVDAPEQTCTVACYVDASVLECFVNGCSITMRHYQQISGPLRSSDASWAIESVMPISSSRLTV